MIRKLSTRRLLALSLASLVLTACSKPESPSVDAGSVSMDVANATYTGLASVPESVTLNDGKWQGEAAVDGGNSFPAAYLSEHLTTRGDMNGDGRPETVAIVVTTSGGSGSFFNLVVFSQRDHGLEQVAARFLGDRLRIRSLEIVDGSLRMVSIEHGKDEAMCCPTQRVDREFTLAANEIELASERLSGPLERTWGYLVWGHESRSFKTCAGDREGWVVDAVDRESIAGLYEEFSTEPYAPVFFDVEGRWIDTPDAALAEDFDEALEVTDIVRVEREGFGCELDVDGLILRGSGNEPGWRLDVREDGATLSSMSFDNNVEFEGNGQLSNQQFEFENAEFRMGVAFLKIPCRDSMSGNYFSHRVQVRFGDREFTGCGIPGRQIVAPPAAGEHFNRGETPES